MKATDTIKSLMSIASGFSDGLLRDMIDDPLTRITPEIGQHPYWLLGHLVVSEAALFDQYLLGQPNRYQSWLPLFGIGTVPTETMDGGPSYQELLDALVETRASITKYIDSLDLPPKN